LSTDTKRIYLIYTCTCIFHLFKYVFIFLLVSAILHHISLLIFLPKSYLKISTFQPNFLWSSSFLHKMNYWVSKLTHITNYDSLNLKGFWVGTCVRVTSPSALRTAYRLILALRTAYRHFSVSRTAYRLTTKTTIFGVSIYMKKIEWHSVACTCAIILSNVSFNVFEC